MTTAAGQGPARTPARRKARQLAKYLRAERPDLIQPYSGHATRQSLEIYSRLALADAQQRYDDVIGDFPV